jgi:hypothetical protein
MKTPLGKLERIPLRHAWAHEAGEFTPWLAQAGNRLLLTELTGQKTNRSFSYQPYIALLAL